MSSILSVLAGFEIGWTLTGTVYLLVTQGLPPRIASRGKYHTPIPLVRLLMLMVIVAVMPGIALLSLLLWLFGRQGIFFWERGGINIRITHDSFRSKRKLHQQWEELEELRDKSADHSDPASAWYSAGMLSVKDANFKTVPPQQYKDIFEMGKQDAVGVKELKPKKARREWTVNGL